MKKQRLEQALSDVDAVFLEEAAAYVPARVRRPIWKRMALIAACLAAVLAISVTAIGVLKNWSYHVTTEDGKKIAWTQVQYEEFVLPEASKEIIRQKMEGLTVADWPKTRLTFDSLAELEAFLGADLLESTLYPVCVSRGISCDLDYQTGSRTVDGITAPYEYFLLRVHYSFDKGGYRNLVTAHISSCGGSMAIGSEREKNFRFEERELEQLGLVAGVLTGLQDGRHTEVYILKDNIAYTINCVQDPAPPADFLDSLY